MPVAKVIYNRNEVADLVRRDAQRRTGQVLLASGMSPTGDGGWGVTIDISVPRTETAPTAEAPSAEEAAA